MISQGELAPAESRWFANTSTLPHERRSVDLGKSKEDANFERKFKDPDGIVFDISEKGWLS